ncbi:shikimate dehydrogenase family protein [Mycolicibacterium goodii]|uniref:Shikimate dehydrogenase n=1 Tax=Mycolicibacterium goodii TaxID=134601 RepID=A0A0K0X271_MYCGD|nr:shikimate dehydrogenase [Mycolicibacterium goodii]
MTKLTGRTRLLGVVGDPVAQVRAPELWSEKFGTLGIDAVCVPFHVRPDDLAAFLDGASRWRNLDGLLITVPHKGAAMRFATQLSERARRVGAVNCLKPGPGGWVADMLDGVGFVTAFENGIGPVEGRRALVIGCGGAGSAIALALADGGAAAVDVSDVDDGRASALAERTAAAGVASRPVAPLGRGYDLIVNASPAGMRGTDPVPVDLGGVGADAAVADVITDPAVTPLIEEATRRGCRVQVGAQMTDAQAGHMASFFGYREVAAVPVSSRPNGAP